jgi:hypothetical protein
MILPAKGNFTFVAAKLQIGARQLSVHRARVHVFLQAKKAMGPQYSGF